MHEKIAQGVKLKNHAMLGFRKVPKGKKTAKEFRSFGGLSDVPLPERIPSRFFDRAAQKTAFLLNTRIL